MGQKETLASGEFCVAQNSVGPGKEVPPEACYARLAYIEALPQKSPSCTPRRHHCAALRTLGIPDRKKLTDCTMSDIFISYSHKDRPHAERLASTVQHLGWSVWWDSGLETGSQFRDAIDAELNCAKCVVVLWSANSVKSNWVRAEASTALDRNVLVPVQLSACDIPLPFREIQAADLSDWAGHLDHGQWQSLRTAVERYAGPAIAGDASELRNAFRQQAFGDITSIWMNESVADELPNLIDEISGLLTNIYLAAARATVDDWRNCAEGTETISSLPVYTKAKFEQALNSAVTTKEVGDVIFRKALAIAALAPIFSDPKFRPEIDWNFPRHLIEIPGHHGILDAPWLASDRALLNSFNQFFDRIADQWAASLWKTLKMLTVSNYHLSKGWLAIPALAAFIPKLMLAVGVALLPIAAYKVAPGRAAINAGLFRIPLPREWREAAKIDDAKFTSDFKIESRVIRERLKEKDVYRLAAQLENAIRDAINHAANVAKLHQG